MTTPYRTPIKLVPLPSDPKPLMRFYPWWPSEKYNAFHYDDAHIGARTGTCEQQGASQADIYLEVDGVDPDDDGAANYYVEWDDVG